MLFRRIAAVKVKKVSGRNAKIVANIEKYGHGREIDAIFDVVDIPPIDRLISRAETPFCVRKAANRWQNSCFSIPIITQSDCTIQSDRFRSVQLAIFLDISC